MITGLQLPAGFTTDTSQDTNSGATLENPEVKIDIATMSCAELAAGNTGDTGFGETAEASSTAVDGADESIDQGVTQFPTTAAAQSFYTAIYAKWFGCRTFTATSDGGSGTGTMTAGTAPTGVGQEAFAATITGQYNGVSSVTHLVGAVEGTDLYLVAVGAVGDSAPTDVDPAALTRQLIANVGRG